MTSALSTSTQDPLSDLEKLPDALLGKIAAHLTEITVDDEGINEADIPVIAKYVFRMRCCSKRLNAAVQSQIFNDLFLESLGKKYKKPSEEMAAKLNTVGRGNGYGPYQR